MVAVTDVSKILKTAIVVRREDIARAKQFVLQETITVTGDLVDKWLKDQQLEVPNMVNYLDDDCPEILERIARAYSLRMALYQSVWELVTSGDIVPVGASQEWEPSLGYSTRHGSGPIPIHNVVYPYLSKFHRVPQNAITDPDIFIHDIGCKDLHPGIREAIEQALGCFRKGLYMPATAMLAAAAEATWTECGIAIAKKLGNAKLEAAVNDLLASISKIVTETRKALEHPDGKTLVKTAGQHISKVTDAEVWTTTLRDRRNALHWGKAKSFIADHSETGTLLMAAPLHLGTLEAIRAAC